MSAPTYRLTWTPRWSGGDPLPPETVEFNGRTLVVLDPEDRPAVVALCNAFWDRRGDLPLAAMGATQMQAALRSLVTPPKPDEPTGLGAVVKESSGLTWVRRHPAGAAWVNAYQRWCAWHDLDVPDESHILSRGVEVKP